ncbi:copper amine oxidase domain protein [Paenibacillus algicola]|uniref:Copper amine oxidase domain protein n=1 Tax=Paenibacillus algicola TaxID=2565926 RepID=A0A4V1G3D7_9BACL|nr:copper amine oxidase N-terminal domain-containing protein [Paenibacillus algicola]QCT00834.1 copper amine oxidase domain protein [Paenibacillus algicola]
MNIPKASKIAGAAVLALSIGFTPAPSTLTGLNTHAAAAASETSPSPFQLRLEHSPFKLNGQVYVPLKELSASLDLLVTPSNDKKNVLALGPKQSLTLTPGRSSAVNATGQVVKLDGAVIVKKGVTYVPASLLSRYFGANVQWSGGTSVKLTAQAPRYVAARTGNMIFWLDKESGKLLLGSQGKAMSPAGSITLRHPDLLDLSVRKVNKDSYVLDLLNAYGEPHIHETRHRVLVYQGQTIKESSTYYGNFSGRPILPSVGGFKGHIPMMDGSKLEIVHPTGKTVKTYDLAQSTGLSGDFSVEVIEEKFLLVRPLKEAVLYLIHPVTGEAKLLYPELLSDQAIEVIQTYPTNESDFDGDGLAYTGYRNGTLTFQWNYSTFLLKESGTFTYKLPF